jgi:hypothetical protein
MKDLNEQAHEFYKDNPGVKGYKFFGNIPVEFHTEGFITAWIMADGRLSEVPKELRTELMLRIAVQHDASALRFITPNDVSDYQSLVLDAVENAITAVAHINPEYLTEDLVIKIAQRRLIILGYMKLDGENKHLLTDKVISSVVSGSISSAMYLSNKFGALVSSRINDEDIRAAINLRFGEVGGLINLRKEYVLADLLRSGYWPTLNEVEDATGRDEVMDKSNMSAMSAPRSPVEAMHKISEIKSKGIRLLYLQSLKLFPIEEVITSTIGIANAPDMLVEAYSEAELKPHMKLSRALRGRLLETGLGL